MAFIHPFADIRLLILDDMPDMRTSLRTQVGSLGIENIALSSTVKDALEQIRSRRFDVILCDYYLAGSTDGQQLLEYLRGRKMIDYGVTFIMVTAEKNYESVVTAAECLPDDYLLKPFTADSLKLRLERMLEKKKRLARIIQFQNKEQWGEVVLACDEVIAARDRYLFDALRSKGEALMLLKRFDAAADFYQQVITIRALPWAKLGLARALAARGDADLSKQTLNELIAESPKLMAAYDLLGELHRTTGNHDEAMAVLEQACKVSPHSLSRHRAIASVAEEGGNFARVEQALELVVKKTRNSPLRETRDFARLGHALTEMGAPEKAASLIEEVRTSFKEDANDPLLAAVEAIAQQKAGNPDKAKAALERAMRAEHARLPADVAMTLARACLTTGEQQAAATILKSIVQNNPDANVLHTNVTNMLREHGSHDLAEQLVNESIREIIQLNNDAVRLAKSGELKVAADMLTEAARRLPSNAQVVANAGVALLFEIYNSGIDEERLTLAKDFQEQVRHLSPESPKLGEMDELLKRITGKYGQPN